jgi:hypothetical protein
MFEEHHRVDLMAVTVKHGQRLRSTNAKDANAEDQKKKGEEDDC